jgi:hypothetical protein
MKISLELKFEQLLQFVRKLPASEKRQLIEVVKRDLEREEEPDEFVLVGSLSDLLGGEVTEPNELQKLLLQGPTWSEEEYKNYLDARRQINQTGVDAIG